MSKTIEEWAAGDGERPPVIVVSAWKGGDGKSTMAREIAYQLDAVLGDFDWDLGGSTRSMGYRHEKFVRAPLLDAFRTGKPPRLVQGRRKADLVMSHPDWQDEQPDRDAVADAIYQWVRHWKRPLVGDTHPGGCPATYGALDAADLIVVPVVLVKESLNALDGMLDELTDYPLLIVPNKVKAPPAWARRKLQRLAAEYDVPVGPIVRYESWLETRTLNTAITSEPVPKRADRYVDSIDKVVQRVINYGG
ncbi:ParA family protein [Streptomyces sp. NPDC002067]